MKIDRLIGIITLLLQNEKVTAPQLAKRFEVSRRTINRDIEDICKAGIPIVTTQGVNGGIAIMEDYKIDKTLFTNTDLQAILTGLSSLDSIAQNHKYSTIIEKLSSRKNSMLCDNHILINLSSHYKDTLAPKIAILEASIESHTQVTFEYHGHKGEKTVTIDPYLIVFQWAHWYTLGYDHHAKHFKLYKLNRICNLKQTDQLYDLQLIPDEALDFDRFFSNEIQAVIHIDQSEKYRIIEEYGVNSFTQTKDHKLRFTFPFTNQEYLLTWVLSFGDKAELIEPRELRPTLHTRLAKAAKHYQE